MKSFESHFNQSTVVLIGLIGMVGCAGQTPPSYPASPPPLTNSAVSRDPAPESGTTAVIKVPADARELSSGDYPPPAFPAPNQPGLIMVIDLDGDPTTAVASTAVTGMDAGKMMSITDVANMSVTMNKLHKYRIVFVPKNKMP